MQKNKKNIVIFAFCVAANICLVTAVYGQLANTPWPMNFHDARHTGYSQYRGPKNPKLKWSFTASSYIYSSPIIGPDKSIYFSGGDYRFYALNSDGTVKWSYYTGYTIYSSAAIGWDSTIYFASNDYKLYAFKPDGNIKWSYYTGYTSYSSPVIGPDSTIYFATNYNLYAVRPTGTIKWSYYTSYTTYSSPAIGPDSTIYIGAGYYLYAFRPNGNIKWSYYSSSTIYSSPTIGPDSTIYFGAGYYLNALRPNGSLKWSYYTSGYIYSTPAIGSGGTIYFGSGDYKLYALKSDGTVRWSYNVGNYIYAAPSIGIDGTIYVSSYNNKVYALNPDGGALLWSYSIGDYAYRYSSPTIGSDTTLYVTTYYGKVYALGDVYPDIATTSTPLHFTYGEVFGAEDSIFYDNGNALGYRTFSAIDPLSGKYYGVRYSPAQTNCKIIAGKINLNAQTAANCSMFVYSSKDSMPDACVEKIPFSPTTGWNTVYSRNPTIFDDEFFIAVFVDTTGKAGIGIDDNGLGYPNREEKSNDRALWDSSSSDVGDYMIRAKVSYGTLGGYDTVKTLTIKNVGQDNLVVTGITKHCSWIVSISPTSFTLTPGSSQNVTVKVSGDGLSDGDYCDSLDVFSNDPDESHYFESLKFTVISPGAEENQNSTTSEFFLSLPYPLNSTTYFVEYGTPKTTNISIDVYDITGRIVKTLVSKNTSPGKYKILWNAVDDNGKKLANGFYFINFSADNFRTTRKLLLLNFNSR